MTSKYEEIATNLVSVVLEMVDITEKFNKMGTKEVDVMIASALNSSKRINSTMKKVLEIDSLVSALRQSITKANLQAMIAPNEDEDPKAEEKPKEEKPKEEKLKEEKPKAEKAKTEEKPKEAEKPKETEKPKAEEKPKEEDKGEKKARARTKKVTEEVSKEDAPKVEEQPKLEEKPKVEEQAKLEEKPKGGRKKKETSPPPTAVEESPKIDDAPKVCSDDEPLHVRRKNIPKHVKTLVWGKFIGNDKPVAKCFSCRHENIDIRSFNCGHVIAEAKGGTCTIDNLRPICAPCNGSMGTMSMNEFTSKYFGWTV